MNDTALYRLMTWLSPSFPVGAYGYSHGLEYAVEAGLVHDSASLREWVKGIVTDGTGRVDAIMFCAAFRAVDEAQGCVTTRLTEIVEMAAAMRGTSELASESLEQGRAFLTTVRAAWPSLHLDGWAAELEREQRTPAYPVAVAVVCALRDITLEAALTAYLHAFVANLVSAGTRLIPLGQIDAQNVVFALEEPVIGAVQVALKCPAGDIGSATPMVDWTCMRHETQRTRLFRS